MITLTFPITVLIIATIIATYIDLKERYVPDFINYFLIIFGIISALLISIIQKNYTIVLISIFGAIAFYLIGGLLYSLGIWGGGDAKLLAGFGAILANITNITVWPSLLTILFNIITFGAIFGVIFSILLAIKYRKKFIKEIRKLLKQYNYIWKILWVSLAITFIFYLRINSINILLIWAMAVILFYLLVSLKAIENVCMYRKIKPSKLVEGDWISKPIKIKNKLIYQPEKTGISKPYIKKLIQLEKNNKLNYIIVKDGVPYVPAFLGALILTIFQIDILFTIFSLLL
jgi:Flp pilus assembly protein protease CpaA